MAESAKINNDFIGRACLQHSLHNRCSVPFLQRNLTLLLDTDARLVDHDDPASHASPASTMIQLQHYPHRRTGWEYPTGDMLAEITRGRGDKPSLKLDALQLREIHGTHPRQWRVTQPSDVAAPMEPSWITSNFTAYCTVHVEVLQDDNNTAIEQTRPLVFRKDQRALIAGRRDEQDALFYDVQLDEPVYIALDELFVNVESSPSGAGGTRRWKRTVSKKYTINITLICDNQTDTDDLMRVLEPTAGHGNPASAAYGVAVNSTWRCLPRCPPDGELLPLANTAWPATYQSTYGMELSMGWSQPKGSALEQCNRAVQRPQLEAQQLPTPSASEPEKTLTPQRAIRYEFEEGLYRRTYVADNLKCMFCSIEGSGRPVIDYPHIARLFLHYQREHDHFNFDLVTNQKHADGRESAKFFLTLNEKPETSDDHKPAEPEDIALGESRPGNVRMYWIKPGRPFNIKEFVDGNHEWLGVSQKAVKKGKQSNLLKQTKGGTMTTPSVKAAKRPALEEIRDLQPLKRRRYVVPFQEGVKFYHTTSKQPAAKDDYFSEEDDDLQEMRLRHSQRYNFKQTGLDDGSCEFHEVFNAHLDREQAGSQVLIRDCVVRFARQYRDRMNYEPSPWRHHYEQKLRLLQTYNIINDVTVKYCMEDVLNLGDSARQSVPTDPSASTQPPMTKSSQNSSGMNVETRFEIPETPEEASMPRPNRTNASPAPSSDSSRQRWRWSAGTFHAHLKTTLHPAEQHATNEMSGSMPPPEQTAALKGKARRKNFCVCDEPVEGMRGNIACNGYLCGRDFHQACVNIDRAIMDWKCHNCIDKAAAAAPRASSSSTASANNIASVRVLLSSMAKR